MKNFRRHAGRRYIRQCVSNDYASWNPLLRRVQVTLCVGNRANGRINHLSNDAAGRRRPDASICHRQVTTGAAYLLTHVPADAPRGPARLFPFFARRRHIVVATQAAQCLFHAAYHRLGCCAVRNLSFGHKPLSSTTSRRDHSDLEASPHGCRRFD